MEAELRHILDLVVVGVVMTDLVVVLGFRVFALVRRREADE